MPISRPLALALALTLAQTAGAEVLAPRVVPFDDDFVVPGSPGWCADLGTAQLDGEPRVVVFGHCDALGRPGATPDARAFLTVSVMRTGDATSAEAIWNYLGTRAGKARLSRSGNADALEVLERSAFGDIYVLHSIDRSPGAPQGTGDDAWRAVMLLDGRLINVSLTGLDGRALPREVALATLLEQCDRIRHANTH